MSLLFRRRHVGLWLSYFISNARPGTTLRLLIFFLSFGIGSQ